MRPMGGEHGQGTVVEVTTPSGRKRLRVVVTMPGGRRVWRTVRTPREAERVRRQLVEMREMELDPTRQTLSEYLRSWLAGLRSAHNQRIRPRTLDTYTIIVETHIIPGLDPRGKRPDDRTLPPPRGSVRLAAVSAQRIQAWVDADQSSPQTVRHHHAVLRRALNLAVRQRMLAYNPANAVELPEVEGGIARPLGVEEARKLLAATAADRLAALWRLALVTGLREGELLGLVWDDVDGSRLAVHAQLQRLSAERGGDANGWARTEPKAARGVTRIALDAETARVLAAHRVRQAGERTAAWRYFGMVFVNERGNPYHAADVRTLFADACKRAGIAGRRFHDLRHTSATLMREAGVAEDTRMARLGHSTTAMARHYGAASEAQDQAAVDTLAGRLSESAS